MYQWLRMGQEGGKPSCIRRPDGAMTANEMEIDQLTREAWEHIYCRWPAGQEPDWTAHRNRFPPPECSKEVPYLPLTKDDLLRAVRRLANRAAGGSDGWRVQELEAMPPCFLTPLAHIYTCIEHGAAWPVAAQQILVSLLSKKGKPSPLNMRPISVTPLLYRVWGAARWADMVLHQETWILPEQNGFRPRSGPVEASGGASLFAEEGHARGLLQMAVDLDLQKAFDHIPRELIWALAERVSMPPHVVTAWKSWYSSDQQRFYRHSGGLGLPWVATSGFVQGCALSCIAQNLLMATLIKALSEEALNHPFVECKQTAYADDTKWQFRAPPNCACELQQAAKAFLRITSHWAKLGCQLFNAGKSAIWLSGECFQGAPFFLQGKLVPLVSRMSFLGAKLPNQRREDTAIQDIRVIKSRPPRRSTASLCCPEKRVLNGGRSPVKSWLPPCTALSPPLCTKALGAPSRELL